jgi:hypothetical protein
VLEQGLAPRLPEREPLLALQEQVRLQERALLALGAPL